MWVANKQKKREEVRDNEDRRVCVCVCLSQCVFMKSHWAQVQFLFSVSITSFSLLNSKTAGHFNHRRSKLKVHSSLFCRLYTQSAEILTFFFLFSQTKPAGLTALHWTGTVTIRVMQPLDLVEGFSSSTCCSSELLLKLFHFLLWSLQGSENTKQSQRDFFPIMDENN